MTSENNFDFTVIIALHKMEDDLKEFVTWFNYVSKDLHNILFIIKDSGFNSKYIKKLNKYPNLIAISEKDNSLYKAWNQAIKYVPTEFVIFLGITDRITHVPKIFRNLSNIQSDLIYFDYIENNSNNYYIKKVDKRFPLKSFPVNIKFCFSCSLIRKRVIDQYPFNFENDYNILGDLAWILRIWKKLRISYILTTPFIIFKKGGISNNPLYFKRRLAEYFTILKYNNYNVMHFLIYYLGSFIKTIILKSN
tara:strand:- start:8429 stop:9178 length:750 start_codon:yes stop_codon:yes gene_type:complete